MDNNIDDVINTINKVRLDKITADSAFGHGYSEVHNTALDWAILAIRTGKLHHHCIGNKDDYKYNNLYGNSSNHSRREATCKTKN